MVVEPVLFFSIASCITQFDNFYEMGKIGGKIVLFYFLTDFAAIATGIASFDVLVFKLSKHRPTCC